MKTIVCFWFTCLVVSHICAQDFAIAQLEKSPRHHEWVEVKYGTRTVHCFVAFPESAKNTPAVVVIHENRGLTDWVRSFADQLAAEGYLAIAPDLLSGFSEDKKRTADFANSDEARMALSQLKPEQVSADLAAVQAYISQLPSCNGKTAIVGFCWGGGQCFRAATQIPSIQAALVFYGSAPEHPEEVARIQAPVYGFYAENDQRINAGIPKIETLMKQANKFFAYEIYKGAGHAFMRSGEEPTGSAENKQARADAWKRMLTILAALK
ncbi:MAG: dienelactone hydrolase family protein [Cytophagales bacterium]|nr:dienelactone hydrolase family protein [Bernardetiaceae bacterium]MDW8204806.1 dienelactone hydrolase family protein [Cytophagales bacterium]